MKTNWTIFFDKGAMKAYKMPELLPEHPDRHYMAGSYGTTMYKEQVQEEQEEIDNENDKRIEAARLSALPVANESKEKVYNLLMEQCSDFKHAYDNHLSAKEYLAKEYQIEAEFREEEDCLRCKDGTPILKNLQIIPSKVLVLSSNH